MLGASEWSAFRGRDVGRVTRWQNIPQILLRICLRPPMTPIVEFRASVDRQRGGLSVSIMGWPTYHLLENGCRWSCVEMEMENAWKKVSGA